MIEWVMLIMLGFFVAGLFALLLAPTVWRRAVRLTTRRLIATMPMSLSDIEADKDMLRASYAIQMRRLETALERAREKSADQLVEISKLHIRIGETERQRGDIQRLLEERNNAANVFEKTLRKRFPELEEQLNAARAALDERGVEVVDLRNKTSRKEEAATLAVQASAHQQQEIRQLREALERSGAENAARFKKRPAQWTLEEYRSEYDRLNLELSKMREQLALAQDRESHQTVVLKAEMQQLAERIMSVSAVQGQQPSTAPSGEETKRPTTAARDALRRSKSPVAERPIAAPRPWPKEQKSEQKEHLLSQDANPPLISPKQDVDVETSASSGESTPVIPTGEDGLTNSATDMRHTSRLTENVTAAAREETQSQPNATPHNDGNSTKMFARTSINAPAVDHSVAQEELVDGRASLKSLLDRGAKVPKVDAAAGQPVFAAMFGNKETAVEARVANTFVPGPEAMPANMTLAALAHVDEAPAVVAAPEPAPETAKDAPMDRMLREIFENRTGAAGEKPAAATAGTVDGTADASATGDTGSTKADLLQRLRAIQDRQLG